MTSVRKRLLLRDLPMLAEALLELPRETQDVFFAAAAEGMAAYRGHWRTIEAGRSPAVEVDPAARDPYPHPSLESWGYRVGWCHEQATCIELARVPAAGSA